MSKERAENSEGRKKIQDLHSPQREPISQGQPFDEQQRQERNPDGSQKGDEE